MESQIKELFYKSKKHSRKWEKYFDVYEELFKKYKNKDIYFYHKRILEDAKFIDKLKNK